MAVWVHALNDYPAEGENYQESESSLEYPLPMICT